MKPKLGPVEVKRRTGKETFRDEGISQKFSLNEFWSWSTSDLVMNITRGPLAEFIVAQALNAADGVRIAWAPFDLSTPEGISVEVKSSAYLQSWEQDRLSTIQFDVAATTPPDAKKGGYRGVKRRDAEVYVFALLAEQDKSKVDPLQLDQWEFYVLPTGVLNNRKRSQHSITLNSLRSLTKAVSFSALRSAVLKARGKRA